MLLAFILGASALSAQTAPPAAPDATDSDVVQLERFVTTATRGSKALDKIPGAVDVVTRQEMDDQLLIAEDIGGVLAARIPSYAPSRQKLTSFGETLRGRSALILFDGVPQSNPLRAGAREGYFADPAIIERIEVINGASAIQGLGATGGIINYLSLTPREEGTRHRLDFRFSTQGHDDDATFKAGYTLLHKQGAFDALLHLGRTSRGVGIDGDGRRLGLESTQGDTQDSQAMDYFLKLGWRPAPGQQLRVSFNRFDLEGDGDWTRVTGNRAAGTPTSARKGGTVVGDVPRNHVRTSSLEWSHANLADGSAQVQLYHQDFTALYGAGTFPVFQDATIAPSGTLVDQSEIVADKQGARASWVRPDLGLDGLEFTGGFDWLADTSAQRLAQTGRRWVPPLEFESLAPFAQLEYERGPFTLRGGLRRESADLQVDTYRTLAAYGSRQVEGGARSFDKLVKNLGAVWRFRAGWSGFVSYSEGFGLPDVGLVLRGVNVDGRSVEELVALEPILTKNEEAGFTWVGRSGSLTASVYQSEAEIGSTTRVDATTGLGYVLRLPTRVRGGEISGEYRPSRDWTLSASYARLLGKTAAAEGQPLDVRLGARDVGPEKLVTAARWRFASGAVAGLQAAHYFSHHINVGRTIGASRIAERFSGYSLFDATFTLETRWGQWGFAVENLLNRSYIGYFSQAWPSGDNDNYFAGRGRTLSVRYRLEF